MTYKQWFHDFQAKHTSIVAKLSQQNYTQEEIINYFDFDNMKVKEPNFCPLYAQNKKCHEMENLNCYLCACPHFRFDDAGIEIKESFTIFSKCTINKGDTFTHEHSIHHDCSSCEIPHDREYISKVFKPEWEKIMSKCNLG